MLTVLRAGPLSAVQDAGRRGHRDSGVSVGGAMDDLAFQLANLLAGNVGGEALIEIAFGPLRVRFEKDTLIALTGADVEARLDTVALSSGWRTPVMAGQVLHVERVRDGVRSYLAVHGGIDVPLVLGSRSTDLRAGFGGFEGRALRDGDVLPLGRKLGLRAAPRRFGLRLLDWRVALRVIPGPEFDQFETQAQSELWAQAWTVTPNNDRMGLRLAGPALKRRRENSLPSHGVIPGVIQVPPSGQPIVLAADAQITGGYARIGVVIQADLWKLAQLRTGAPLRFQASTAAAARIAQAERRAYLQRVEQEIHARGP